MSHHRQKGAVILTVSLVLLFLLGFMGIAMDFGHLFVVKTELQTAMDSCALAAAQELDKATDALTRATGAGETAGKLNKINFQGAAADIVDADITFSDSLTGAYSRAPAVSAQYAKCTHTKSGMAPWLLQAMAGFTGNASYTASQSVFAQAVATRQSAQTSCAIPVGINPKNGGTPPNFGYAPGEWIPSLYDESATSADLAPGHFGWANLDGSPSAAETKAELLSTGFCNVRVADAVTHGAKVAASVEWNSRFGLYKNGAGNPNIDTATPDMTGYAYTVKSWTPQARAAADFLLKRATNVPYEGDASAGLKLGNSYNAADASALATQGGDRRLVLAPFVDGSSKITAFGCVLMLAPIDGPKVTVFLEYVGAASDPASPCTSSGLAGGTGGPFVPVLVQ
jgi:Flp pilus assembly protein TadG